jgi:hypothetical protein
MANVIMGHDGEVRMDNAGSTGIANTVKVAEIDSFTLNMSADAIEVTAYGDSDKEYEYGLRGGTFSFSGTLASTELGTTKGQDAIQAMFLSTGSLRKPWFRVPLSTKAGSSVDHKIFRGLVTGYSLGSNVNDKQTFSAEVQITGGLQTT